MSTTIPIPTQSYDEQEIMDLFKSQETREKAFTIIVKTHQERLYWHIRRFVVHHEDTNDMLQNVFVKVWKGLDNFKGESSFYTWLYRIATNECLTYLENQKKRRSFSLSDHETGLINRVKNQEGFDYDKLEWKLQIAIQSLPEKQRAVFTLRYYDEMPYEQIAEVLDIKVGALKTSYHFASKRIEEILLKEN